MRSILIASLLTLSVNMVFSQSLDDINDMMGKLQYKEARTGIDKYLSNPKKVNDADAYYYKGRIYNSLSHDSTVPQPEQLILKNDAFDAFKKNQELDSKDVYLSLETHTSYLDLYYGLYDLGARSYNSNNYENAISSFKKAIEVETFIIDKKYEFPQTNLNRLDTALVLNIAACAIQIKNVPLAIEYYTKITNANASGPDFKEVYQYLVDQYSKSGDEANFNSILQKAKRIYPKEEYWVDAELKAVSKKGDKASLFSKYEELIQQDPSSFVMPYNYAVEIYNSLYGKDASNQGDIVMSQKLTEIIKKAIANEDKADITATMLMSNHLYNMSADLVNSANMIKSTKPEDVKKKNDMKSVANKSMDECITYSELALKYYEAIPSKTPIQKANYKIVLGYMADIYGLKKNPVKAAEYEKKSAAADKL
ncbi:MAG: hypothetical protein WCH52_03670 [Bacteroidota bacterium]